MNKDKVVETMVTIQKGANIVVEWTREAKTRKGVTDIIEKSVRMVGRIGIEYDNLGVVKEKRASGELPSENQGLKWGNYEIYPYLIEHKGNHYLRLYKSTCAIIQPKVTWTLNGGVVYKDEIAPMLLKSEVDSQEGDCFTVNIKSITRLHKETEGVEQTTERVAETQPITETTEI